MRTLLSGAAALLLAAATPAAMGGCGGGPDHAGEPARANARETEPAAGAADTADGPGGPAPRPSQPETRERDEQRLAALLVQAYDLGSTQAPADDILVVARDIVALLEQLTGWPQGDPKYELGARELIREVTRRYAPDLHLTIVEAEKEIVEAQRRAAIAMTKYQLLQVRGALQQFEAEFGGLPETLAQLGSDAFDVRLTRDAWGRPMIYEVRGSGYALGSLGADGERGTADDLDAADAVKVIPGRKDK